MSPTRSRWIWPSLIGMVLSAMATSGVISLLLWPLIGYVTLALSMLIGAGVCALWPWQYFEIYWDGMEQDQRVRARSRQRADYLKRWENREPGFARCQECREVIRLEDDHDCRNPNPPIRMVMRG